MISNQTSNADHCSPTVLDKPEAHVCACHEVCLVCYAGGRESPSGFAARQQLDREGSGAALLGVCYSSTYTCAVTIFMFAVI